MRKTFPLFPILLLFFAFTSCRDEAVTPIRNVRFDPNLLNKLTDGTPCTNYSYTIANEKRHLGAVNTRQLLIVFADNLSEKQKEQTLERYEFVWQANNHGNRATGLKRTILLKPGLGCKQVEQALKILSEDNRIIYAAPYFISGSNLLGLSNEALVSIKSGSLSLLEQYAADFNARITRPLGENTYLIKVDKQSKGNTLDLIAYLQGKAGIILAEPDFILSLPVQDRLEPQRNVISGTTNRR